MVTLGADGRTRKPARGPRTTTLLREPGPSVRRVTDTRHAPVRAQGQTPSEKHVKHRRRKRLRGVAGWAHRVPLAMVSTRPRLPPVPIMSTGASFPRSPSPGVARRAPRRVRRALLTVAFLPAVVASLAACNTKRVSRIDPASVTDLSGRWNDADSRLVANALVTQALSGQWLARGSAGRGGRFANRTMEHIPVGTFVRDVERAFVTSNAVTIVASADERVEVRGERADQQQNATADTRVRLAREQGARYMLQGDVQAIEDAQGREQVVTYQVDATLVDLESNAKVWVGQHKIKKYVDRRRLGW
jgi:hypothetical protein